MTIPALDGCVVLSSRQSLSLPIFSRSLLNEHIVGSFNGSVGSRASFRTEVFNPSRGRSFSVFSSTPLDERHFYNLLSDIGSRQADDLRLRDLFHAGVATLPLESPSALCIEQRSPFGFVAIHSRNVTVHFVGIYNKNCAVLYWTTIDNFDDLLRTDFPNEFWVHRFRPLHDFSAVIFVKRMCSRWYRWSDTLPDVSQRFQALENSLLNSAVCFDANLRLPSGPA